jgi:hypothetical protein
MMNLPNGLMCKCVRYPKSVSADWPFFKMISLRVATTTSDFTCNHVHVVLGGRLSSDLALGVRPHAGVQHGIGNLIEHLVWVIDPR